MADLRKRQPDRSLWRIFIWQFMQSVTWLYLVVLYRARAWGVRHIPADGPVLFACNHQGFYDPILISAFGSKRHFYSFARHTLFENKISKLFANWSNSIPVQQGAGDTKAMKRCIEVLKEDQALMLFPEGARTMTGEVEKFETGAMLIIKRAKPTVVPVAVEGVYDVWPRGQSKPHWSGRIGIMFGKPIPADELTALKADAALELLRGRVDEMRKQVGQRIGLPPAARS